MGVLNLTVVATASRRETVEFCKAQGAHFAISHRKPLLPQLEEINIPKVNYIMNCANWGDSQLSEWADCLAPLGQITSILPPTSAIEPATFGKLFFLRAQLNMELMWVRTLKNVEPEKQGEILDALHGRKPQGGVRGEQFRHGHGQDVHRRQRSVFCWISSFPYARRCLSNSQPTLHCTRSCADRQVVAASDDRTYAVCCLGLRYEGHPESSQSHC